MTSVFTKLADSPLQQVTLAEPLTFGRSRVEDLRLLRSLREATSHAVRLRWRLAGRPTFPLRTHVHLVPPSDGLDPAARAWATAWAAQYQYGSFYYRHGPGFVTVKDNRPGGDANRMVISEGAAEFLSMADADRVGDLTPAARRMLPDAVGAGLVIVVEPALLVLPYRIRHWPIPAFAI
jgi:Family of unknown function (DUF5825)